MLRSLGTAVLWALLLLSSLPALAEEDSWAYATVATGPLERVEACFEELGVPLPSFLRREKLEGDLPLIGEGGLRGAGSLAMRLGPGEPGATKPNTLLLFPLKPGVAPLKEFTARGARLLPGSRDTVRLQSTVLRRTRGFLIMASDEMGVTGLEPLELEERLAAPGLLAEIDVDLERWRKTDPSTFYALLASKETSEEENPHSVSLGHSLGTRIYERLLNRLRITLSDGGSSLRVSFGLEPLAPGEIAALPKPAFPSAALGRVDIAYSSTESSQWLQGVAEQMVTAAEKDGIFAEAQRAGLDITEARALFKEALEIFWIADALSFSVESVKGKIVYHQVNQYRAPGDFTGRLLAVVKRLNEFDRRNGRRASFGISTYKALGARITRLTFSRSKHVLDFVDAGTRVRIVAAGDLQRRLPGLLKLSDEGPLTSGFSGVLDPGASVKAYVAGGGYLPLSLSSWPGGASGELMTWSTRAEGEAAVVDLDVPKPVAQVLFQILEGGAFGRSSSEL